MAKLQSVRLPDPDMKCHVICTMSPSQVLRQSFDPVVELTWRKDLAVVADSIALEPPKQADPLSCVGVTRSSAKIAAFLRSIIERKAAIAFDYETTGLKPHKEGHHAYSVAVSPARNVSRAFLCGPDQPGWYEGGELRELWRYILHSRDIVKIAHNAPFEWTWSRASFDVETNNMEDTRLLAHLEDCRGGWTGLKFQAFVKYGIIGYENEVDRFLKTPKTPQESEFGENGMNSVERAPVKPLLTYNAIDALVTRWLWEDYKGIPYR
jgi:DNA polymerase I-like protein with 3'-5' exonuclease and polymerase domains